VCLRKIAIPSSRLAERSLAIRGSARLKRFLTTTIVTIRDVRARDQSEYVTRSETETRRMAEERERRGERGRRGGRGGGARRRIPFPSLVALYGRRVAASFRPVSLCRARTVASPRTRAPLRPRHASRLGQVNAEPFAGWKGG